MREAKGMKSASKFFPVILCGGSGTRLWPLSRRDFPKQFAIVRDGESLFARTFGSAGQCGGLKRRFPLRPARLELRRGSNAAMLFHC